MKFAEHLSAHITPEWRKQYITYEASFSDDHLNDACNIALLSNVNVTMFFSVATCDFDPTYFSEKDGSHRSDEILHYSYM